jgi:hypothetical protein
MEVEMNRIGGCILAGFLVLSLASTTVWAQAETAQISGIIKDSSGAVLPGVQVTATQTATGTKRSTVSNETGNYVLPSLPPGPYMLQAELPGFKSHIQTGIVLQVDERPEINLVLQVGQVSEQVEVQADAALVESRTSAIGHVVTNQEVAEMPLNGRDPHELIFLAGMANYPGAASFNSIRNYPTVVVSVAGGNGDTTAYLLDGVMWQDPYNSLSLPLPFPDALQEFKVETSAAPPQYGFHAGATVNALTKSGTNEYHGDLFEFVRNGDLNARDAFAAKRDTLKRNQFGGVIGGPIKKGKMFFFGGYQRTSLRSDGQQNTAFIPTPAAIAGDFTALASPACNNGRQITLPSGFGFVDDKISPALLNPVALNIAKTLPAVDDPCGRTLYGLVANQDENLVTAKVDYQISEKNSIFGRYMSGQLTQSSTYDGHNPLSINTGAVHDLDYGVVLGDTYLFTSTLINALRVGVNRTNVVTTQDNVSSWAGYGANVTPLSQTIISLAATGAFNIGGGPASSKGSHSTPMWSIFDDLSLVKGAHQIGIGGSIFKQGLNYFSYGPAVGTATFTGQQTGLILGDFMLGRMSTFSQGTIYGFYERQFYDSLYAQDTWKLHSRFTLNYGLRWEPYLSPYNNRGENEHFDFSLFAQNVHSNVFTNAPAGLVFPGDPQYTSGKYINGPVWKKFYPRIGIAWDPQGNGRMTIRAGFGMFGDRASMLNSSNIFNSPPFGSAVTVSNGTLSDPWVNYPGGNPMPLLSSLQGVGVYAHNIPFPLSGQYVNSPLSNFHPTYENQWNLSVQRQFGNDWLLSANYVGNSTIHMLSGENVNPAVYIPGVGDAIGNCTYNGQRVPFTVSPGAACSTVGNQQSRRLLSLQNPAAGQYYGPIGQIDDGGTATYEGLFLSAQKRMSHGVTAQANYTWSHCIGDVYNGNASSTGNVPPNNRRLYRGNCAGIDLRQQFVLNLVATTPKFSNRTLRILVGNWQVAPILQIKSAGEFSVFTGTDQALTTVANQPPVLINPNPYPSKQTLDNWISRSAFAPAPLGTYGNVGYNSFKGPGVFQLNMAVSRNFSLGEKRSIQLRGEAFNLPNHVNGTFGAPGSINLNSTNFGHITQDISGNGGLLPGDYRVIQLALKFAF